MSKAEGVVEESATSTVDLTTVSKVLRTLEQCTGEHKKDTEKLAHELMRALLRLETAIATAELTKLQAHKATP